MNGRYLQLPHEGKMVDMEEFIIWKLWYKKYNIMRAARILYAVYLLPMPWWDIWSTNITIIGNKKSRVFGS